MSALLVIAAAFVAWSTRPRPDVDYDADGNTIVSDAPPVAHVTWAVVCVAMVAGLVLYAAVIR